MREGRPASTRCKTPAPRGGAGSAAGLSAESGYFVRLGCAGLNRSFPELGILYEFVVPKPPNLRFKTSAR